MKPMRVALFLPIAFLSGADGLVLLVPYVIFMATVAGLSARMKQRRALQPVRIKRSRFSRSDLELEAAAL
jgi:hypothetical protein